MGSKQNPFSLYDFLGYFTPGAISLYVGLVFLWHGQQNNADAPKRLIEHLSFDKNEIYIPFILAAYTLGHLLSFISSLTIERYAVWAHGYPSKYLLGHNYPAYLSRQPSTAKSTLIAVQEWLGTSARVLMAIALLPIFLLDQLSGVTGMRAIYASQLDRLLALALRIKVIRLVRECGEIADPKKISNSRESDYFRLAYHYAVEKAPAHLPKMQNYVALYGFLRTLTLVSLLAFWVTIWHSFNYTWTYLQMFWLILSTGSLAFVFFMGFIKFYRRFSLEALMALAVTYPVSKS